MWYIQTVNSVSCIVMQVHASYTGELAQQTYVGRAYSYLL